MSFALFGAVVLAAYYMVPRGGQWIVLLLASGFFYWMAGPAYLVFLLTTIASTYTAARMIYARQKKRDAYLTEHKQELSREEKKACKAKVKSGSRVILTVCLVLNFGMLAVCKGMLVEPLRTLAKDGPMEFLTLGLPMGISFYLFQTVGYLVDVYRETAGAEGNLAKYALFAGYFPQLIQGPISKYQELAPQLTAHHSFDGQQVAFGLERMLWGYFKKLVLADRIAVAIGALKGPEDTGAAFLLLTVFYAIEIYGDFTGGIDVVLGLSQALGIRLEENFVWPYFSKNIAEYWRRWHITLGRWMKDYIFYPVSVSEPMRKLSKNARKKLPNLGKRLPVYVASVITWLCTGIWHGFIPNFVLWGLLNCAVIVASEELQPVYDAFHARFGWKDKSWYGWFEVVRMFLLMNLIRACDLFPNVGDYAARMGSLLTTFNYHILWDGTLLQLGLTALDYGIVAVGVAVCFGVSLAQERGGPIRPRIARLPALVRYGLVFALVLSIVLFGCYGIGYDAGNFIYNQF